MQLSLAAKPEMLPVPDRIIEACPSMTRAIVLCQELSGIEDKQLLGARGIVGDQAQWSRIKSGQHFFPQDKLALYMDACGNEVPLLWLARQRGYELRPLETKTERELRLEREERQRLENENRLLRGLLVGRAG